MSIGVEKRGSFYEETAPAAWTIQASEDLHAWSRLTSGTNAPVNVAVVTADVPQLFFRLKSL